MAAFSTTDLTLSAALLIVVLGAAAWLIASDRKHDAQRRVIAERWHKDYFRRGGLVWDLMARWSAQPKLTDRSKKTIRINPSGMPTIEVVSSSIVLTARECASGRLSVG